MALSRVKPHSENGIISSSSEEVRSSFGNAKSTGVIATALVEGGRDDADARLKGLRACAFGDFPELTSRPQSPRGESKYPRTSQNGLNSCALTLPFPSPRAVRDRVR
jgi:hypothetical protein